MLLPQGKEQHIVIELTLRVAKPRLQRVHPFPLASSQCSRLLEFQLCRTILPSKRRVDGRSQIFDSLDLHRWLVLVPDGESYAD